MYQKITKFASEKWCDMERFALLSFDAEEFDVPRERGVDIPLAESVRVSAEGMMRVLDILDSHNVKATFFCTRNFASMAPDVIDRIIRGGHEIAAHGVDHWNLHPSDTRLSFEYFDSLCRSLPECHPLWGYRQPRMVVPDAAEIAPVGFRYDSSLNPTWIPGHYNNLRSPRTPFLNGPLLEIPVSVSPRLRIPLFWLAMHHLPMALYRFLALQCLRKDGLFNTYFHPWEFVDLRNPAWKIGYLHRHLSGQRMLDRLSHLILFLKKHDAKFITYSQLAKTLLS